MHSHSHSNTHMGWLRLVGSSKLYVSLAEYSLFYRALFQKRPILLGSLLIVATTYLCHRLFISAFAPQHASIHWKTLQHPATPCNTLQHPATPCNTLQHTAAQCSTLKARVRDGIERMWVQKAYHIYIFAVTLQDTAATPCNTLQETARHCKTLQHTATHCNALQHTATHCNTLQHTASTRARQNWNERKWVHRAWHTYIRIPTATHCRNCNTLQHTATHCERVCGNWINREWVHRAYHIFFSALPLQHTATHYSTLQHTATQNERACGDWIERAWLHTAWHLF